MILAKDYIRWKDVEGIETKKKFQWTKVPFWIREIEDEDEGEMQAKRDDVTEFFADISPKQQQQQQRKQSEDAAAFFSDFNWQLRANSTAVTPNQNKSYQYKNIHAYTYLLAAV